MTDPCTGFPPVARRDARILILGSMPGDASLRAGQYYAHPYNHFWPIMGALCGAGPELPYRRRLARLRAAGIALWDVLRECRRHGSLDAAVELRTATANELLPFLRAHPGIGRVLFNGALAARIWHRRIQPGVERELPGLELLRLPSTSPAHAAVSRARKLRQWRAACALSPRASPAGSSGGSVRTARSRRPAPPAPAPRRTPAGSAHRRAARRARAAG